MRQLLSGTCLLVCLFGAIAMGQQPASPRRPTVRAAHSARFVSPPAAPISARAAVAAPQRLSLADFEAWEVQNNPTIAAAEALVRQQQGMWRQAGLYPNPTAGYLRTDPNQSGQSETQGLFLSQEFVTAKKLRLAQAAERQDIEWRRGNSMRSAAAS